MNKELEIQDLSVSLAASETMFTSLNRTEPSAGTEEDDKPVALLISHGMGQQVPFSTLADVVELLQGSESNSSQKPVVRHIRMLDPDSKREIWLPRAELVLTSPKQKPRRVHVYEVYWAPLTEGNISLSEVIRFMATSGWQGMRVRRDKKTESLPKATEEKNTRTFQRWLFGRFHSFPAPKSTMWGLPVVLLMVVSLVIINTIMTLVVGANVLDITKVSQMPYQLVDSLTLDLLLLLLLAAPAALGLYFSNKLSEKITKLSLKSALSDVEGLKLNRLRSRQWVHSLAWGLVAVACAALVVMAFIFAFHYLTLSHPSSANHREASPVFSALRSLLITVVWAVTVGISLYLRSFFVQYMGDVAIYIDSYKVDKFHKVREEVKRQAYQTACALYGARLSDAAEASFAYERIVLAGHSLGSVVSYDALNATLHIDESMGHFLRAAERTGGLVTFGSPLDKTAYIFHTQTAPTSIRPPLAASVQPLLREATIREKVKWINIYSTNDIISDRLDYYDPPQPTEPVTSWVVENQIDEDARTPLLAHVQYWGNVKLANAIRRQLFGS